MATSTLANVNTGNQPYTPARIDYLASYLQQLLPGLNHDVAVKWIRAEQGVNGNVLGVTYSDASGQHLYRYSSQEAGLRAAVALLHANPAYHSILASLGRSSVAQLTAIAASPWAHKGYYAKAFGLGGSHDGGGTSTITKAKSTATSAKKVLGPSPGGVILASNTNYGWSLPGANAGDFQKVLDALAALGISTDPGHVLTQAEATAITNQFWTPAAGDKQKYIDSMTGMSVAQYAAQVLHLSDALTPITSAIAPWADGLAKIFAFLLDIENWKYILAVIVGVPLALFGFYLLAGVQTAGPQAQA